MGLPSPSVAGVNRARRETFEQVASSRSGLPLDPVTDVGGGIKVAAVRDPLGNRFGLIENPSFDPASVR